MARTNLQQPLNFYLFIFGASEENKNRMRWLFTLHKFFQLFRSQPHQMIRTFVCLPVDGRVRWGWVWFDSSLIKFTASMKSIRHAFSKDDGESSINAPKFGFKSLVACELWVSHSSLAPIPRLESWIIHWSQLYRCFDVASICVEFHRAYHRRKPFNQLTSHREGEIWNASRISLE